MGDYDYRCPGCDEREIVFVKFVGKDVIFDCLTCRKHFFVEDQESGYLHKKVNSLKEKYPPRPKKRRKKALSSLRKKDGPKLRRDDKGNIVLETEPFIRVVK